MSLSWIFVSFRLNSPVIRPFAASPPTRRPNESNTASPTLTSTASVTLTVPSTFPPFTIVNEPASSVSPVPNVPPSTKIEASELFWITSVIYVPSTVISPLFVIEPPLTFPVIFTFPSFVISAIFCTEAAELSIAIFKTPVSVLFILPVLELVLFKFIVPLFVITASAVVEIEPKISAVTFSSITRLDVSFTLIEDAASLFNPLPIETLCEPVIFVTEAAAA